MHQQSPFVKYYLRKMGWSNHRPTAWRLFLIGRNMVCRLQRTAFQALAALTQAILDHAQNWG